MQYHTLRIGKIERKLPLVVVNPKVKIASFNLLGDTEIVSFLAKKLYAKLKKYKFDYLVGPEVKVVPLLHELSRLLKKEKYIVCRKNIHGYMVSPLKSGNLPGLVINGSDAELIKGKKIVIIDDVVTSGQTIHAVEELMKKSEASVIAKLAIFKQGDKLHPKQKDIIFLGKLPVFSP